jgi:hypothetical protein
MPDWDPKPTVNASTSEQKLFELVELNRELVQQNKAAIAQQRPVVLNMAGWFLLLVGVVLICFVIVLNAEFYDGVTKALNDDEQGAGLKDLMFVTLYVGQGIGSVLVGIALILVSLFVCK